MKDIPMFSTDNGVASLSLQQIPYTGFAHITIHSTVAFEAFLQECVGFCRAAGADTILASGHSNLECYPIYTKLLRMQMPTPNDNGHACLFPLTEDTLDTWMDIYNGRMKSVPNAVIMSKQKAKEFLKKGVAYFVHDNGELLGIGVIEDDEVRVIVSCKKGEGETVMRTLCSAIYADTVKVDVAENNIPAVKLYCRMGFVVTALIKTWYDVSKNFSNVK
jgi:ribosomal protein S18 acetylase RimI-like enzyme